MILPEFAAQVRARAARVPVDSPYRFGREKVFIAALGLDAAGRARLVEAHRAGLLTLTRADLTTAMDPALVAASEVAYMHAQFHLIVAPYEAAPASVFGTVYTEQAALQRQDVARLRAKGRIDSAASAERSAARLDEMATRANADELAGDERYRVEMARLEREGRQLANDPTAFERPKRRVPSPKVVAARHARRAAREEAARVKEDQKRARLASKEDRARAKHARAMARITPSEAYRALERTYREAWHEHVNSRGDRLVHLQVMADTIARILAMPKAERGGVDAEAMKVWRARRTRTAADLRKEQRARAVRTEERSPLPLRGLQSWECEELERQIARDLKTKARARVVELAAAIRDAKVRRAQAISAARAGCRAGRTAARERVRAFRREAMWAIRQTIRAEQAKARTSCANAKAAAKSRSPLAAARDKLTAERAYQRDLRRLEAQNRSRTRAFSKATTKAERRGESDDEVRGNIPADLVPLWERVKKRIRPRGRTSRTEAFLHYAEEHASEVVEAIDDVSEARIAELVRQKNAAERFARKRKYTAAELAEVPF